MQMLSLTKGRVRIDRRVAGKLTLRCLRTPGNLPHDHVQHFALALD
jgi:hypothetical protein